MNNKQSIYLILLPLFLATEISFAQSKGIGFQAYLKKPDGTAPTATGVTVTVDILDPITNCVLREEEHSNVNITNGYMNLHVGAVGATTPAGLNPATILSLSEVLDNSTDKTGLNCVDGNNNITLTGQTYHPSETHGRKLRVKMVVDSDTVIADFNIRGVAYASNSEALGGKASSDYIQRSTNITQSNLESLLSQLTSINTILSGTYSGNAATATSATTATNVTGTVAIANGGTGATTASAAINALLPSQTGNSGKYLTTNGTTASWSSVAAGGVTSVAGKTGAVTLQAADITDFNTAADARITAQKGAASGVASLSASSLVPTAQLGTGTADNTKYLRGDGTWSAVSTTDSTKLPLAGGTMTGGIAMGGFDITNSGNIVMAASKTLGLSANATDPASPSVGQMWYNSTSNTIKYFDGAVKTLGVSGSGLSSLNGQTGSTQTFAVGASGTAPAFNSATNTHTLNIPMASTASVTAGLISKTDYDNFNGKLAANASFGGDVSGTYNAITLNTVPVSKGGTGATTATAGFDALSPLTTKGDIIVHNGTNNIRLAVGSDGQALVADSAQASGVKWGAIVASEISSLATTGIVQRNGASSYSTVTVNAPLTYSSGALGVTVGTAANTLAAGDDSRITGALQKSGGTMTGGIAMGGFDITNSGNIVMAASKTLGLSANATDPASPSVGQMWYNSTSNTIKYYDGAVKTLSSGSTSQWVTSGSDIYYTTGKVGIGTTGPGHLLHVSSSSATAGMAVNSATGTNSYLEFYENGTKKANVYYKPADTTFQVNDVGSVPTVINGGGGNISLGSSASVITANGAFHALAERAQVSVNSGTALTLSANSGGNIYRVTLTGNATITLPSDPGITNGVTQIVVVVAQDATGARTLTWAPGAGATIAWATGTIPSYCTTASQESIYQFMKINGNARWYASQVWRECP